MTRAITFRLGLGAGLGLVAGAALAGCSRATGEETAAARPAAAGGAATTSGGHGPAVQYRAAPAAAYTVQRHDSVAFQFPGGQSQTQLIDRTMYFRVALDGAAAAPTAAEGDLKVTVTLDSVRNAGGGMAARMLAAAEGAHWTGTLTRAGRLLGVTNDKPSEVTAQIGGTLQSLFFPALPPGGARDGAEWPHADTTMVQAPSISLQEVASGRTRATAVEAGGQHALRLQGDDAITQGGTGSLSGQSVQIQGGGTRRHEHTLATDGRLLGATGGDSLSLTYTVPAMGQSVPAIQVGRFTLTPGGESAPPR